MYVIFIVQHKRGSVAPPFPLNSLDSSPALFDTASQAVDTVLELEFIYPAGPDEISRPTFFVVDAHYDYDWALNCTGEGKPCGKCTACIEGMEDLYKSAVYHT